MNWLQDGAFRPYLTPSRNPIWRLENRKMLGNQRKYELSLLVLQLQIKFQRLPPHFRLCPTQPCQRRHCPTSADIRNPKWRPRKPEVEITLELFPLLVSWPIFFVPDVGRCRAMSAVSYLSRAWSQMWGLPLEPLRQFFPFKSHFHFRVKVRHFELRWSHISRFCVGLMS